MGSTQATYARHGQHAGLWYHKSCRQTPWPSDADVERNISGSVADEGGVNGDGTAGSIGNDKKADDNPELRRHDASESNLGTAPAVRHFGFMFDSVSALSGSVNEQR